MATGETFGDHCAMTTGKDTKTRSSKISTAQLRAAKALGDDFVMVRVSATPARGPVPVAESAKALVTKAAVAMKKPGIDKASVFRGAKAKKVYAYSVLPSDVTKVVRESVDGVRHIGRFGVDGRFRVLSKAA
jgi:hypothetical protein